MKKEKIIKPSSGYAMLFLSIICLILGIFGLARLENAWFVILIFVFIFSIPGFFLVNPNTSKVLLLFGKYIGSVKENGFYWANPFYTKRFLSLRASNFDSERVKVNDKLGNPIMISTILVWRVKDTYKAAFEVLRSSLNEVSKALEEEIEERLAIAGIEVLEARIAYLAYAQEIAQAMLKRQQATAIIAARQKIVEGAVGMVEMALNHLSKHNIVELDEERRAAMVSNLMVVLCSDKDASPVINTGTLNH